MTAVVSGVHKWWQANKGRQFCVENPGQSAMREMPEVVAKLGHGMEVWGCEYGRQSRKPYRLWMSPETQAAFEEQEAGRARCPLCTAYPQKPHPQAAMPKAGSGRQRISEEGYSREAAANRVPAKLAKAVASAMWTAWSQHGSPR